MSEASNNDRVIAAIAVDLESSPIGMASRLTRAFGGTRVLQRTVERVTQVTAVEQTVLMAPVAQMDHVRELIVGMPRVEVMELLPRPTGLDQRIRAGRPWGLHAWRGGAGQWTVFDEDYHPASVDAAVKKAGAGHVLCVPAHAALLDVAMTAALVEHHLHKNHEMRLTYTPAAPGLCGIVLQAGIVAEMAQANAVPGQLLAYDPKAPTFDTLIRDACMQVDPALSKIANRFLLDTDRAWAWAERLLPRMPFACSANMARAVGEHRAFGHPIELEIELTGRRQTHPPGAVPALVREARGHLDAAVWERWLTSQRFADDVLLTFCGDGDPLLYPDLRRVLKAARQAKPLAIHVQTDLLGDISELAAAITDGLIETLSVQFYGDDAATYRKVAGTDGFDQVMANMTKLAGLIRGRGGVPLVVPRLLKVRDTIPHLEPFFDKWIQACGWAVIDGPTDRAGQVPFAAVVDMAPPKRRACRRIDPGLGRLLIRANGAAVACDQDMLDRLTLGHIESHTLEQLWTSPAAVALRAAHASAQWSDTAPCQHCREWHRP